MEATSLVSSTATGLQPSSSSSSNSSGPSTGHRLILGLCVVCAVAVLIISFFLVRLILYGENDVRTCAERQRLALPRWWANMQDYVSKRTSVSDRVLKSSGVRYLILRNYNDEGGFFWQIYNLLCAGHIASRYGLQLAVVFDSGVYLERKRDFQNKYAAFVKCNPDNWFHYYFQGLAEHYQPVLHEAIHNRSSMIFQAPALTCRNRVPQIDRSVKVYEFTRETFENRPLDVDYHAMWNRYVHVRPHIQQRVDAFVREHLTGATHIIGIHYRGTDKYSTHDSSEDGPVHYAYEFCEAIVRQQVAAAHAACHHSIVILVCSDEQPFIDFMRRQMTDQRLVYTDCIRSSINTSGQDLHGETCIDPHDPRPNCEILRGIKHHSIHLGMPNESSYQKGEDVLVDVLLLARCNVFLRSRGNVSNFPFYINPGMKVIDLVDVHARR